MPAMELETDANGLVTWLPMAKWGVHIVDGRTVGLAFDYYASAADAAAERPTRVQLHLDADAAQILGQAIDKRGEMILNGRSAADG
jgi:hypothetical protein